MAIVIVRQTLLWCFVINTGLLLWWFLLFALAHDWVYRWHSKWYKLSVEQFDAIHYAGMAFYKIAIFFFTFVPWLALLIAA
ncbi:MAG: hypothetical protein JXR94_09055 [Candidatus Hydrogenedentes bacterium]|nr:hypothetical protein [Candidatus Hydrogenedentota bacterium]